MTSTGSEPIMVVNFAKPVRVLADSVYIFTAQITGPPTRRGIGGLARRVVQTSKGAVKFSFSASSMSTIHDNVTYGLLPQIMFRV
ncbi:hypothetical protein AAVH_36750 [Aphelenchoides avenae]|nr:hypothetical protein AAVH_36750 [Aphelenchus avenae]